MKLTKNQFKAIALDSNTKLEACPGAGKTRTLVAKLIQTSEQVKSSSRRIACITYTNAAVYEIESRLSVYADSDAMDSCDISTIHGFCLNNILRNFNWKLEELVEGFSIATPDSEEFIKTAKQVCADYGLNRSAAANFEQLNRKLDGSPIVPFDISVDAAVAFWKRMLEEKLLDFPSIIYYSLKILTQYSNVARIISSRYEWILVDEFQDTSELQLEILKNIYSKGKANFFVVGDKNQSIYGFAGAVPQNFDLFASHFKAQSPAALNENFRSSKAIVDLANVLIPENGNRMVSKKGHSAGDIIPQYLHTANIHSSVVDFIQEAKKMGIENGEIAILAPWWINLLLLGRHLRGCGFSITGPGSRPYKRSHLIAPLLEQLCILLTEKNSHQLFKVQKEIFELLTNMVGRADYRISGFDKKFISNKILRHAVVEKSRCNNTQDWILNMSNIIEKVFLEKEMISNKYIGVLHSSGYEICTDMSQNDVDPKKLSLEDFSLFSSNKNSIKLLTLHRSKGREFDAVAIINVNNGRIPHFSAKTQKELDEAKRLLYVGVTRARKYLVLMSDSEDRRNGPSPFLENLLVSGFLKKK